MEYGDEVISIAPAIVYQLVNAFSTYANQGETISLLNKLIRFRTSS